MESKKNRPHKSSKDNSEIKKKLEVEIEVEGYTSDNEYNSFEEHEEIQNYSNEMDKYCDKLEFYYKVFNQIKEFINFNILPIGDNLTIEHIELLLEKTNF